MKLSNLGGVIMKNKLYIVVFIIAVILLFPKPQTPYSGTYYAGSTNIKLVLNSDNSFDFYITSYKNSIPISGKYRISNNHIELLANDKNDTFFINKILSGEITGSLITFKQAKDGSSTIFTKS